jgi:hypothetical protein
MYEGCDFTFGGIEVNPGPKVEDFDPGKEMARVLGVRGEESSIVRVLFGGEGEACGSKILTFCVVASLATR